MLCYVMLCYVMLCYVMSCHVMSCHVLSCHVMSCHVMSCHVMLCHVMSCHVIYYVMLYYIMTFIIIVTCLETQAAVEAWGRQAVPQLEAEERLAIACEKSPTDDPVISKLRAAFQVNKRLHKVFIYFFCTLLLYSCCWPLLKRICILSLRPALLQTAKLS